MNEQVVEQNDDEPSPDDHEPEADISPENV